MEFKYPALVDLHIHSNASDGTLTPKAILNQAARLGLKAVSITDHDTIEGAREALSVVNRDFPCFITGVEISAALPPQVGHSGSCHILGYGIDVEEAGINSTLAILQNARKNRNPHIIEKLNQLGIPLTLADVTNSASDNQTGRPHIAKAMVENGYAASISDAFDRYLAVGQAAYVDKFRISAADAIQMIRKAGGIAVLAHPYLLTPNQGSRFEDLMAHLTSCGLEGIEAYYTEHSPEITRYYLDTAQRHHLLVTGGSDFHGAIRPDIQMGCGNGYLNVPPAVYEQLSLALDRRRPRFNHKA